MAISEEGDEDDPERLKAEAAAAEAAAREGAAGPEGSNPGKRCLLNSTNPKLNSRIPLNSRFCQRDFASGVRHLPGECIEGCARRDATVVDFSADHTPRLNKICNMCFLPQNKERKPDTILPCTHSYCTPCIEQWNVDHKTCPVCRETVNDATDEGWVVSEGPVIHTKL